jgi:hypothetical protein
MVQAGMSQCRTRGGQLRIPNGSFAARLLGFALFKKLTWQWRPGRGRCWAHQLTLATAADEAENQLPLRLQVHPGAMGAVEQQRSFQAAHYRRGKFDWR